MNAEERKKAVESLKKICVEIGCSGLAPDVCQKPYLCSIIRKICMSSNVEITRAATDKRETTAPIFGVGLIDGLCQIKRRGDG